MLKDSEDIAKRDGFKSAAEMVEWFKKSQSALSDEALFDVIRW